MSGVSKYSSFTPAGSPSWVAGQVPNWQGGAFDGWRHVKSVYAVDFTNGRAMSGASDALVETCVSTTRASPHYVKDSDGTYLKFDIDTLAMIAGKGAFVGGVFTNKIQNPRGEGGTLGLLGSGGVLPTDWSIAAGGLACKLIEAGVEGGLSYVDLEMSGTASGASATLNFRPLAGNIAAAGQAWGYDLVLKYLNAPAAAPDSVQLDIQEYSVAGSFLTNIPAYISIPMTRERREYKKVLTQSTVANLRPVIVFRLTPSHVYAFSVRIYAPKLIQIAVVGSYPGYMPTYAILPPMGARGNSTRSADVVKVIADHAQPFLLWEAAKLDEGASVIVAMDFSHIGDGAMRPLFEISDGSVNNYVSAFIDENDCATLEIVAGGVVQASVALAASARIGVLSVICAWNAGGGYLCDDAGDMVNFATVTLPAGLTQMQVGGSLTGAYFNDTLHQIQVSSPLKPSEAVFWTQTA